MRVLRHAWPLAGVLFVSLASADPAWGDDQRSVPDPSAAATAGTADAVPSFRLFGKTWCLGDRSPATPCDFTVPAAPATAAETPPADTARERPVDRFMAALRRLFTGSPSSATTASAAGPSSGRGDG